MTAVIPMAGRGSRFVADGYGVPKPLIPVLDLPMFAWAAKSLPRADRYILICQEQFVRRHSLRSLVSDRLPNGLILTLDGTTEGQACTCLVAESLLEPETPLMISACDYMVVYEEGAYQDLLRDPNVDVIIWTFRLGSLPNRDPRAYAYCRTIDGRVVEVVEKQPISDRPNMDPAVVGTFTYRRARDFVWATKNMIAKNVRVQNEFHVATSLNELIEAGKTVVSFTVEKFICLGEPFDLELYHAWEEFFYREGTHPYRG